MIDQYQLHNGFFNQLDESGSLLSFQPTFSYVPHLSHSSDISGLTTTSCSPEFPTSPVFPCLQDSTQVRSESYSPENLNPQTPSPSVRSRRRTSHVAAPQHSASASSPSYAPSPYLTSPTESAKLTSPQLSLYPTLVPRTDQSKIITPANGDDRFDVSPRKKRKSLPPTPSSSSPSPPRAPTHDLDREQLTPADALLVRLREDEGMAWRDVAARFRAETGRDFSVAALQMRLKRLRERARPWTERDVAALRLAHDYWISHKFEIIAAKVRFPFRPWFLI
jgi:hypothetical protein